MVQKTLSNGARLEKFFTELGKDRAATMDLTLAQTLCLIHIGRNPGVKRVDLAKVVPITAAKMNIAMADLNLANRALVDIYSDPRRGKGQTRFMKLTPAGEQFIQTLEKHFPA